MVKEPQRTNDFSTEQVNRQILSRRPLNRQRRNVRLKDPYIGTTLPGDGFSPEPQVAVRDRKPEPIIGQTQHHRIVDEVAVMITDRRVPSPTRFQARQVASRKVLGDARSIRADNLDLAFGWPRPRAPPAQSAVDILQPTSP